MLKCDWALALSVIAFGAAPALAGDDFSTPVTKDFWEDSVTWDGGLGKAYDFRWHTMVVDGHIAVCGAGKYLDPTTRGATVDLMRHTKVIVGGKTMLEDVSFFSKVKFSQDFASVKATCRDTGFKEPQGEYQIQMDWPMNRVRF